MTLETDGFENLRLSTGSVCSLGSTPARRRRRAPVGFVPPVVRPRPRKRRPSDEELTPEQEAILRELFGIEDEA